MGGGSNEIMKAGKQSDFQAKKVPLSSVYTEEVHNVQSILHNSVFLELHEMSHTDLRGGQTETS